MFIFFYRWKCTSFILFSFFLFTVIYYHFGVRAQVKFQVFCTAWFLHVSALSILVASLTLAVGTLIAATKLHSEILMRVLRSPMSFFDTTPSGRIVNRFGKDVDVVDNALPHILRSWLNCIISVWRSYYVQSESRKNGSPCVVCKALTTLF